MQPNAATIGHNQPPEETPFEVISAKINDLYDEAKNWCDGEPISTQGQADEVSKLMGMIREAEKEADALRKKEVAPLDEAKKEIQDRYNPLIGKTTKITGKTVMALDACKAAQKPWLVKLEAEKREKEEAARKEAEEAAQRAREAREAAEPTDLAAAEEAEALTQAAMAAQKAADKASKDKARASGGGRATTLRTYYDAVINDETAFARWVWTNKRQDMREFMQALAQRMTDANMRSIPGVEVVERKEVV